jgi:hypothetical protein
VPAQPGFFKQHQRLLGIVVPPGDEVVSRFKGLLSEIAELLATAEQTLKDRRAHREGCAAPRVRAREAETQDALVGLAFSYQGLLRLTPGADALPSEAFRQGLAMRSPLLGDPVGNAAKWIVGKPGQELDALVVVAAGGRLRHSL